MKGNMYLLTEEEFCKLMACAYSDGKHDSEDTWDEPEPIHVPDDEEIKEASYKDNVARKTTIGDIHTFREGAKWMREQILKTKRK